MTGREQRAGADDESYLRRQERKAYDALRRLRGVLDALPGDHPSRAMVAQAVTTAEQYWRLTREDVAAIEQAESGPHEQDARG